MGFLDKRQEHTGYSKTKPKFLKIFFFLPSMFVLMNTSMESCTSVSKTNTRQTSDVLISSHFLFRVVICIISVCFPGV